jgi:ribosomal protein S18 acetylase RimI-like enzyme
MQQGKENLMTMPKIKTASQTDIDSCVDAIVLAFSTDPCVRWMYPDPHQYLENMPHFVRAFGGKAFASGTAYYLDRFAGVTLWMPPDAQPDEEKLLTLIKHSVVESQQETIFALFGQMAGYHPSEPHWHLPLIGVDPIWQSRGFGSMLLKHALFTCNYQKLPIYLEATNPKNVRLYERHGFEVVGTIQVGTSPPLVPMLRKPQ